MTSPKTKTKKILLMALILLALSSFFTVQTSQAWFGEQAFNDFKDCLKGECPEEQSTSFTQFTGGLSVPDQTQYAEGLVRETNLRDFVINVTNFILGFLGLIAILIIVYGGFLYLTAAGEQEKAEKGKKSVTYAIIGIVLILGSYAIVNTVLQAPTGEDTGLRGSGDFGIGISGSSGQVNFNNLAVQVEKIAREIVSAHTFHFEAQKALNEAKEVIDGADNILQTCSTNGDACGGGTNTTSGAIASTYTTAFGSEISKAIRILEETKGSVTSDVVTAQFIRQTIDDEVAALNDIKALIESRRSAIADRILSDMDVFEGSIDTEHITPAFQEAISSPYDTLIDEINQAHEDTGNALDSNFESVVENGVNDLSDIYTSVQPLTETLNFLFYALVSDNKLIQGSCGGAGGAGLCQLIKDVNSFSGDTPGPGDAAYDNMEQAYRDFVDLYDGLSNLEFVNVKLTASVVEGSAPLAVTFSSVGSTDPSGVTIEPEQIDWDLDGDGSYSNSTLSLDRYLQCNEAGGVTTSCIYKQPGTYRVKLRIEPADEAADQIGPGIATIDIRVNEPQTKINLRIPNMLSDNKDIIKYDDGGFIDIDKSSVIFPLSIASGQGVQFDASFTRTKDDDAFFNQSANGATVYWDFGDNSNDGINKTLMAATQGNLQQTHIYNEEGNYNVMVEFTDQNGVVDRKIFTLIISSLAPQINLTPYSAKVGQPIEFDGGDSISDNGPITSYSWSLSPSVTGLSETENEAFTYSFETPNTYDVTLTVTDAIKTEGVSVSEQLKIESEPPVAQFTYTIPESTQPATAELDGTKSYDPDGNAELEYLWEINGQSLKDNTVGNELGYSYDTTNPARPIVKFKDKDTYTVALTVIDPNGGGQGVEQDSKPLEREITINKTIDAAWGAEDEPTGSLQMNETTGESEAPVQFTLVSDNAIAYEIDYGDGEVEQGEMSQTLNLTHAYKEAGVFVVQASVFDIDDEENNIKRKVFISSGDAPAAVIGLSVNGEEIYDLTEPLIINRKDAITFDAGQSINTDGTGRRLTYSWDFGDGQRSTDKTATHTYREIGDYTVTLKVVNENDVSQTATDKIDLTVQGEPPLLKSLTAVPVSADLTAPVTVQLNAVGAEDPDGQITRYRWWYYDPSNDQDELGVQVTSGPSANVTIGTRGSEGEEKTYRFAVELTDDENNTISSEDILAPGVIPTLDVINGPNDAPRASFNVDRTNIFVGEEVNFTSASTDPDGQIVAYFWDWEGDGFANNSTDEGPNVSHIFDTPAPDGVRVRLKVRDNNDSEATSQPVTIYVDSMAEPPVAAFTTEQEDESTTVNFTDNSTADEINKLNIEKWNWDFDVNLDSNGDGIKDNDLDSTDQNPSYTYPEYGIYRARLTVYDDQGQSSSITNFVNVKTAQSATPSQPATSPTTTTPTATLDARLLTQPAPSLMDGKIHLKGTSGNITLDYSTSVGDITSYIIDKNVYFDTNGNGVNDDDEDYKSSTPGKWTTDFAKEWGNIRVRLTVIDQNGRKDFVEKDVVFDNSALGANIFATRSNEAAPLLVSIAVFAIITISLRKLLNKNNA